MKKSLLLLFALILLLPGCRIHDAACLCPQSSYLNGISIVTDGRKLYLRAANS